MNLFEMKRNYKPVKCDLLQEEQMQWFRDAKFGMLEVEMGALVQWNGVVCEEQKMYGLWDGI